MIGVYKFTNKYNRKIYVGQSLDVMHRKYQHISNSKSAKGRSYFHNALNKYGKDGFDFDILIDLSWLKECTKEERKLVLDYWEEFYIRYYCSDNPQYGYNLTKGGHNGPNNPPNLGKHFTKEHCDSLSKSLKQLYSTGDFKEKKRESTKTAWATGKYKNRKSTKGTKFNMKKSHKNKHWVYDETLNKRVWL